MSTFVWKPEIQLKADHNATKENYSLRDSQLEVVCKENKEMREAILDLQSRSTRDNLVFSIIPEQTKQKNPEQLIKELMITQLKIPRTDMSSSHMIEKASKQMPTSSSSKIWTL